jgi:hypothetical protein
VCGLLNKELTDKESEIISEIIALRSRKEKEVDRDVNPLIILYINLSSLQEKNNEFKAICQFRELFDVDSVHGMIPKINELYIFCVEVRQGLDKLKAALECDAQADPKQVLLLAAEKLESLAA